MMNETLTVLANTLLFSAPIPIVIFILRYGFFSPWRSRTEGRIIMFQFVAFLAYFCLVIVSVLHPDFPGREIVRVIIYSGLVTMFWFMAINLVRVQRKFKKTKKDKNV